MSPPPQAVFRLDVNAFCVLLCFAACRTVHETWGGRCPVHLASSGIRSSREIQRSGEVEFYFAFEMRHFFSLIRISEARGGEERRGGITQPIPDAIFRLYCTVEEPDLAINMYKKLAQVRTRWQPSARVDTWPKLRPCRTPGRWSVRIVELLTVSTHRDYGRSVRIAQCIHES